MSPSPAALYQISIRRDTYSYNHPHDLLGIIETAILDGYKSRELREGSTVVDIGAGVGDFAVVASHRVGTTGTVVAIEPDGEDYACLLINIEANQCRNVVPIRAAVSDREEDATISFKGRSSRCRTRRLQDLLVEARVDPGSIRFVKIDIEGAERVVIPDNLDILGQCERVAMELHDGADLVLHPLMEQKGFFFRRISRHEYMLATLKFCIRHPIQSWRVYRAAKRAESFHGVGKLLRGLEIASSDNLIVGEYVRRES